MNFTKSPIGNSRKVKKVLLENSKTYQIILFVEKSENNPMRIRVSIYDSAHFMIRLTSFIKFTKYPTRCHWHEYDTKTKYFSCK